MLHGSSLHAVSVDILGGHILKLEQPPLQLLVDASRNQAVEEDSSEDEPDDDPNDRPPDQPLQPASAHRREAARVDGLVADRHQSEHGGGGDPEVLEGDQELLRGRLREVHHPTPQRAGALPPLAPTPFALPPRNGDRHGVGQAVCLQVERDLVLVQPEELRLDHGGPVGVPDA
eukprot:CAMPEP_0179313146 /NCGR_PEP_ID=MMETSP0797-20121207/53659_1 /TAXON_ID=47934 /ORGANISM="Dinophysis acuminata, Strain DAEP01" /LENGTH=173 /DNA_ID=CAMNT_0021023157 /DNA_START=129 /DNA_END=647 /DNA_ORIENTATION=+